MLCKQVAKMVVGRLNKFYEETVLVDQVFLVSPIFYSFADKKGGGGDGERMWWCV